MSKDSNYVNPQSMQRTPSWTNPLKFMQNKVFKNFLTSDNRQRAERGEKPGAHEPLHKRVAYHLDEIEKKRGVRSIKHILTD